MSYPKIVYDPGTGPTTLAFLRAPRHVPAFVLAGVRQDNVSTSGVRESIFLRADSFLEIEMEWVASGSDVQAWSNFINYALRGGQFAYYPDASLTTFTNYWLEDTTWNAAYRAPGQYQFKLRLRQVVT